MKKLEALIASNTLSLSRGLMALLGAKATIDGDVPLATGLFVAGLATDIADGVIAKKNGVESRVGWWNDRTNDAIYIPSVIYFILSQTNRVDTSPTSAILFISLGFISYLSTKYVIDHNKGII